MVREMTIPISQRTGRRLISAMPTYLTEHMARAAEQYHPLDRPGGYIGLAVAENKLMTDWLEPRFSTARTVPVSALAYGDMAGSERFRNSVARFLSTRLTGTPLSADHIVTMAGAGAILEALFNVLADPGESVLVPTPSYSGFWPDLRARAELQIVEVPTDPWGSLTTDDLDRALAGAATPVRALLLCSPDNPTGRIHTADRLAEIVEWCRRNRLHLVSDEIYGLSVHGEGPFTSIAAVAEPGDDIHIVWAVSKDLALSGLRAGVLISTNRAVLDAMRVQAAWGAVSGDTQVMLADLLDDTDWTTGFLAESTLRLGRSHHLTVDALDGLGVATIPAQAGFFVLADMREFLPDSTWEAETDLWRRILDGAGVNLTPGAACRIREPGFMRICFAAVDPGYLAVGLDRLADVLG